MSQWGKLRSEVKRESGIGHENSAVALEHYTQLKTVYVELGAVACSYR